MQLGTPLVRNGEETSFQPGYAVEALEGFIERLLICDFLYVVPRKYGSGHPRN
jgi:hypothetical protein